MKNFLPLLVISFFCSLSSYLEGQSSGQLDRDEYFRRLELRALSLSEKFAEISGTEPVRLITPRPVAEKADPVPVSGYTPQQYFDALPGTNAEDSESSSAAFVNPLEAEVGQDYVVETKPSMEERLGEYYLRPSIGVQFPRDQNFIDDIGDSYFLESSAGYSLGLHAGRRIDNFHFGLRLGYYFNELTGRKEFGSSLKNIDLQNELLSFVGTLGYSAAMTEKLTFDFGLGLGFGSRFNYGSVHVFDPIWSIDEKGAIPSAKKTVFSYEFSLLLDYAYTENLSVFAGYRLMGASANDAFERMMSHIVEFGVGANF